MTSAGDIKPLGRSHAYGDPRVAMLTSWIQRSDWPSSRQMDILIQHPVDTRLDVRPRGYLN